MSASPMASLQDAFDSRWTPVTETGCWLWTGATDKDGYGLISRGVGNPRIRSHRASLMLRGVDIPNGMCVCHKCDTPSCVNPDHLYVGTRAQNNKDISDRARGWWINGDPKARGALALPTIKRGSQNKVSKLTEEMVREALLLRDKFMGCELAVKYGVARNTMYKALRGETWAHVHTDALS